ncbi:acetate--CoA ligase [Kordiimonas marina]|uniref:acetate--CoA ligase n=1 Tax=Kordiimonas marina TaxID=2872312 RepID=UPI001FF1B265|nr:acetate--CoA ligase [Kordiimonas marina]MCJ9428847.1 acetate--CoA ligase [Kordiimonas marina]
MTARTVIHQKNDPKCPPNMDDYGAVRARFTWEGARRTLDGLAGGGLNIAYEAVDRHVRHGKGDKTAIRWLAKSGEVTDISYAELKTRTARFAAALESLGVKKGDRVFALLGRVPELYITALGTLKRGAVFSPLFSAFGPEPVKARMGIGEGQVLVTTAQYYRKKVAPIRADLPKLTHVLIVGDGDLPEGTQSFDGLMKRARDDFETVTTQEEDPALLHFTSGTTGKPKGAIHVHQAVVAHHATAELALDLHESDILWCTADPGWVTGTSYGIIAPLTIGVTMIIDEAEFDAERWYKTLQDQKVTVWYSAPTAIRMLMKTGADLAKGYDLMSLRFLASVGEPLNAEAVLWSNDVFGKPFHDNWWQTETGAIMIANFAVGDVKPGSMGRPLPGVDAGIVDREADGSLKDVTETGAVGELALRPGWPSMFRGYLHEEERYKKCFVDGWYLTGDLAMRDADGYFWFVGRADDMIKSSGHLIGPFEVESALVEHPAVAEAAVIGIPDERAGEVVKAYVTLHHGYEASDELERDIMAHARRALGSAVAPRLITFAADLPKTRSGKIMRRLLKARELGLPEGDTSTLETFS